MGLFERIKAWFTRKVFPAAQVPDPSPHMENEPTTEGDSFVQEHEQLGVECTQLRQEIEVVDSHYSSVEIRATDRNRAYRMRLARARQISMRQLEIRSRLVKMGHPIPEDWGAIHFLR